MSSKYRYDQRPVKQKKRRVVIVVGGLLAIIFVVVGLLLLDLRGSKSNGVVGKESTVLQSGSQSAQHMNIDEDLFSMELPADWKQIKNQRSPSEHFITWQATSKTESNRELTIFIDNLPTSKPLNRLVAVSADGPKLMVGEASDNCPSFTIGGTLDLKAAIKLKPTPSKYQQVDFICNLPNPIDNEVGTGSPGSINSVTVEGLTKGKHKYFFLFTDHSAQPNYSIFIDALRSFKAK